MHHPGTGAPIGVAGVYISSGDPRAAATISYTSSSCDLDEMYTAVTPIGVGQQSSFQDDVYITTI